MKNLNLLFMSLMIGVIKTNESGSSLSELDPQINPVVSDQDHVSPAESEIENKNDNFHNNLVNVEEGGIVNDEENTTNDEEDDGESDEKNWIILPGIIVPGIFRGIYYGRNCCNLHFNDIRNCCNHGGQGSCCGTIDSSYYGINCCNYNDTWKKICCQKRGYGECCTDCCNMSDETLKKECCQKTGSGDCCLSLPSIITTTPIATNNCCGFPTFLLESCCVSSGGTGLCCINNPYFRQNCCTLIDPWKTSCCHSGGVGTCCNYFH